MVAAAYVAEARGSGALGTDPVINKPAGAATGDLLVAMLSGGATPTITPPADANPWILGESSTPGIRLYYKFLTAADSGIATFTFAFSGAGNAVGNIVCFSGVSTVTPFDGISVVFTTTTGNIVIPQVTLTGTRFLFSMVQKIVSNAGQTFTPPGTTTERYDGATSNGFGTAGGQELAVAAGATGSRTWDPSNATSALVGGYLFGLVDASTAYTKSMTAVMDGNPTLATRFMALRSLTAVMAGNSTLARLVNAHRLLSVVMDGTPSLATRTVRYVTQSAVMNGVSSIARKVGKTLSVVMDGTATLSRKVGKFLTVIMDGTPTLSRDVTAHRTLSATMNGVPFVTTGSSRFRALTTVMDGSPTVGTQSVLARVLSAVMNGMPKGFVEFPWDAIPSDCPEDWSPNDGTKSIEGFVFFHEPPNEGDPVPGATVTLIRDSDGLRIGSTLTDVAGHYSFPRDTNDPYTYHVEVRHTNQQGLSEGGCVPA